MAKGLRASKNKVNNARLRAKVFGPAENARKERLSAKLLELASKPRPATEEDTRMEVEDQVDNAKKSEVDMEAQVKPQEEGMDLDPVREVASRKPSRNSDRIQKRGRHKARSSMVFPVYRKSRRARLRTKPRV